MFDDEVISVNDYATRIKDCGFYDAACDSLSADEYAKYMKESSLMRCPLDMITVKEYKKALEKAHSVTASEKEFETKVEKYLKENRVTNPMEKFLH